MQRGRVRRVYRSDRRRALPSLHAVHRCARRPSHPDRRGPDGRGKEVYTYAYGEAGAVQCGFCIPGMVICTKALLDQNPTPTKRDQNALRNNYRRCTGYVKIIAAVKLAAKLKREGRHPGAERERLEGRLERPPARRRGKGPRHGQISRRLVRPQHDLWFRRPREICARSRQGHRREQGAGHAGRLRVVLTAEDIPGENKVGHISTTSIRSSQSAV